MFTDVQAEAAIEYARSLGQDHGTNAAGWFLQEAPFGGRNTSGDPERGACDAYEIAFSQAAEDEIVRVLRLHLEEDDQS